MKKKNEKQKLTDEELDWELSLEKNGPVVTTFYEPKKMSEKLKENLRYLGMLYAPDKKMKS